MLSHISVGVRDVARAAEFYDSVLGALGYRRVLEMLPTAIAYGDKAPTFWVQLPRGQQELTVGNGTHIAIAATTVEAIAAFHAAALEKGGVDDGAPGPRPEYSDDYYAAFVIDPDGNRLEAVLVPPSVAEVKAKPTKNKAAKKAAKKADKKVEKKAAPAPKKAAAKPGKKVAPAKVKKAVPVKAAGKKPVKKIAAPKAGNKKADKKKGGKKAKKK